MIDRSGDLLTPVIWQFVRRRPEHNARPEHYTLARWLTRKIPEAVGNVGGSHSCLAKFVPRGLGCISVNKYGQ